jgi:hypothetical protein
MRYRIAGSNSKKHLKQHIAFGGVVSLKEFYVIMTQLNFRLSF